jgi:glucosamine-6-phosphate deaminase
VPYAVKADAISKTLRSAETDPMVPASLLKTHPDFRLFADDGSWNNLDSADINIFASGSCEIVRG